MKIEKLNLNKMIETKLKVNKIHLIEELSSYTDEELEEILDENEVKIVREKLNEIGIYYPESSISTLGLSEDVVKFLRDSYIHTIDELLLIKDKDLEDYVGVIDLALSIKGYTRVCNLDDIEAGIYEVQERRKLFNKKILENRYMNSRKDEWAYGYPIQDSVRILGGKWELIEAMGYYLIEDLTNLTRKQFLDLTILLDEEDLLDTLHQLGYNCEWEIESVSIKNPKIKSLN